MRASWPMGLSTRKGVYLSRMFPFFSTYQLSDSEATGELLWILRNPSKSNLTAFERILRNQCPSGTIDYKDAMDFFDQAINVEPKPPILTFNQILLVISRLEQHSAVFSMHYRLTHENIIPDLYTLRILFRCCFRMNHLGFGFAVLSAMIKRGYKLGLITFTDIIKGFCTNNRVIQSVEMLQKMDGPRS